MQDAPLRTVADFKNHAQIAHVDDKSLYGVKGHSPFSLIMHLPMAAQIDYMHTVLHGVFADDLNKILFGYNGCNVIIPPTSKEIFAQLNYAIAQ